jgi:hypothetical protein
MQKISVIPNPDRLVCLPIFEGASSSQAAGASATQIFQLLAMGMKMPVSLAGGGQITCRGSCHFIGRAQFSGILTGGP